MARILFFQNRTNPNKPKTEVGTGPIEQFFQAGKITPQRKNKTENLVKTTKAPIRCVLFSDIIDLYSFFSIHKLAFSLQNSRVHAEIFDE